MTTRLGIDTAFPANINRVFAGGQIERMTKVDDAFLFLLPADSFSLRFLAIESGTEQDLFSWIDDRNILAMSEYLKSDTKVI